MILTLKNNTLLPYKYIVRYTFQSSEVIQYTDTTEPYRQMVNKEKEYSNFSYTELALTDKQQSRFDFILSLGDKVNLMLDLNYINDFVEFGYINDSSPEYLKELLKEENEYSLGHRSYVISKVLSNIKEKRKLREVSGVKFNDDYTASTDENSRLSITSLLMTVDAGIVTEVNYKFEEGYKLLNKEDIKLLVKLVLSHTQLCFNAEKLAIEKIETLSLEEVSEYLDKHKTNDMFDDYYRQLYIASLS